MPQDEQKYFKKINLDKNMQKDFKKIKNIHNSKNNLHFI
jgi:hypothetical protein